MSVHLPKGTRDFLPDQMNNRQRVIDTVRNVFKRFGFEPMETPAFERIETLTGKYGDEGDKLIYKILKRGEAGTRGETDLALRYDLTVPFARVMAMHPEIKLPFRRHQIQPVWRADRPQRGRFREFWQCDVDVVGSASPVVDAECVAVVDASLKALGFSKYTIRLNDRRILSDLAKLVGATTESEEVGVLVALDKLDKSSQERVSTDLLSQGFQEENLEKFWSVVLASGSNTEILDQLREALGDAAGEGCEILAQLLQFAHDLGVDPTTIHVDPTLARGLDYYTGPVFETIVDEPKIGSISGGGRYDDLIGMFSKKSIPAVGVSLGLERLITVMEELDMLPKNQSGVNVFVALFDESMRSTSLLLAKQLRANGISVEVQVDPAKLGKQFKSAHMRNIPWVALIGPEEAQKQLIQIKHLPTGEQATLSESDVIAAVQRNAI